MGRSDQTADAAPWQFGKATENCGGPPDVPAGVFSFLASGKQVTVSAAAQQKAAALLQQFQDDSADVFLNAPCMQLLAAPSPAAQQDTILNAAQEAPCADVHDRSVADEGAGTAQDEAVPDTVPLDLDLPADGLQRSPPAQESAYSRDDAEATSVQTNEECQRAILCQLQQPQQVPITSGFATEPGCALPVSEAATAVFADDSLITGLDQQKEMAPEEFGLECQVPQDCPGAQKADPPIERAGYMSCQSHQEQKEPPSNQQPAAFGFATASGRALSVSDAAMARAAALFADDSLQQDHVAVPHHLGEAEAENMALNHPAAALQGCPRAEEADPQREQTGAVPWQSHQEQRTFPSKLPLQELPAVFGFATASGRAISASKAAMAKAAVLFADHPLQHDASAGLDQRGEDAGLAMAQALLGDQYSDQQAEPALRQANAAFSGFATGLGKPVRIAADKLAAAQRLMGASDENGTSEQQGRKHEPTRILEAEAGPSGWATASGKKMDVPAEGLPAARTFLHDGPMAPRDVADQNAESDGGQDHQRRLLPEVCPADRSPLRKRSRFAVQNENDAAMSNTAMSPQAVQARISHFKKLSRAY